MTAVAVQGQQFLAAPASHTFAVWSSLPVASRLPSGLQATLLTVPLWPLQGQQFLARARVPHLRRVVLAPVASRLPSGLQATLWPPKVSLTWEARIALCNCCWASGKPACRRGQVAAQPAMPSMWLVRDPQLAMSGRGNQLACTGCGFLGPRDDAYQSENDCHRGGPAYQ